MDNGNWTSDPSGTAIETMKLPFEAGWATSIGGLPHRDPHAAAAFVLLHQPDLPAAPTLPMRSPLEGMLTQGLWGVPGIAFDANGDFEVDLDALDPEAPLADNARQGDPFVGINVFLDAVAGRTAPIKLQLTGPVTLGLALTMHGVAADHAFRVALHAVKEHGAALVAAAKKAAPDAPLVIFLDEPALVGTSQSGFPLDTNGIIDLVSGAIASLEDHAVTGVHCCGEADWKAILMAGPHVLSMPVGHGATQAAGAISVFVERGGWIAWGAVPTSAPVGEHAGIYWKTLSSQWCELVRNGADPVLIRRQSLITPECGLALHGETQAEHVIKLCGSVAASLQEQAVGIKLSVGA